MLKRLTWQEVNTAGKIEMIRSAYRPGITAAVIAEKIGTSRAAVMTVYSRNRAALSDRPLISVGNRGAKNGFSRWPQEERDQIAGLLREGHSALEIAQRMGKTRGGIIGIVHRDPALKAIGLKGSKGGTQEQGKRKIRGGSVSLNRLKPDAIFDTYSAGAATVGRPLSMLRARQCRFAVNDAERGQEHLFCGAEADGSWCAYHRALVYQPSKKVNATDPAMAA